jgi:hypothetical protein
LLLCAISDSSYCATNNKAVASRRTREIRFFGILFLIHNCTQTIASFLWIEKHSEISFHYSFSQIHKERNFYLIKSLLSFHSKSLRIFSSVFNVLPKKKLAQKEKKYSILFLLYDLVLSGRMSSHTSGGWSTNNSSSRRSFICEISLHFKFMYIMWNLVYKYIFLQFYCHWMFIWIELNLNFLLFILTFCVKECLVPFCSPLAILSWIAIKIFVLLLKKTIWTFSRPMRHNWQSKIFYWKSIKKEQIIAEVFLH